jgi:hypothetical protein
MVQSDKQLRESYGMDVTAEIFDFYCGDLRV